MTQSRPVLILGAGVNGACVARELALNGVPVVVADVHDLATGATAKSSRLIHGGLRYLEYADFALVRESLHERARLLKLAPQFVTPLRLHIPLRRRTGGFLQAGIRFLKLNRSAGKLKSTDRGLWAVRAGLRLYDWFARGDGLPRHQVHPATSASVPRIDRRSYRWTCSYFDAHMAYPERFVIAILQDACAAAKSAGTKCDVLPYHRCERSGSAVRLIPVDEGRRNNPGLELEPATIVNATGAWGDATLAQLDVDSPKLFGGTKGSHIITANSRLISALNGDAVYAEAPDGRLVFVLPFENHVLIGTTDERFHDPPDQAVATTHEVRYLLEMANRVFREVTLTEADVLAHYCGVRPLPRVSAGKTGAIPRGHSIETNLDGPIPIDTLIGGKLTTCRAFGEFAADRIFERLGITRGANTRERAVPGAEDFPPASERETWIDEIAAEARCSRAAVAKSVALCGSRAAAILRSEPDDGDSGGRAIPQCMIDEIIHSEWVTHLEDLVERRLMLAWSEELTIETLSSLADRMIAAGVTRPADRETEIARSLQRLRRFYGRRIAGAAGGESPSA